MLQQYHINNLLSLAPFSLANPASKGFRGFRFRCSSDSFSNSTQGPRGFGGGRSKSPPKPPEQSSPSTTDSKEIISHRSNSIPNQAPALSIQTDGRPSNTPMDIQFEERLQAVKRSAIQQKKAEEKQYDVIDYDAPIEPKSGTLGAKIGAIFATGIFGLVFAFGDFLPTESVSPTEEASSVGKKISSEEREILKKRLQHFEQARSISNEDPDALEVSKTIDFEVLRGITHALLAAKKPGESVQVLLAFREQLNRDKPVFSEDKLESNTVGKSSQVDPIQVDLLLGKAYSDWGHVSDAVAIYDQLISSHPDDFRGYLAKGIILKENGNVGGAERMFLQARFYAPEKAKALVDKYSR